MSEFIKAVAAEVAALQVQQIQERNLRIIQHELDTPMRSHDENGACCRRAAMGIEATT